MRLKRDTKKISSRPMLPALVAVICLSTGLITQTRAADIAVTNPYARAVSTVVSNSAGFMTLKNNDDEAITLVSADSDVAARTEIHGHAMEGDMMRMYKVKKGLVMKPGEQLELKPGGYHVMLMGLKRELSAGEQENVTLHFSDGDAIDLKLPVKNLGKGRASHHHHHHHHHHHSHKANIHQDIEFLQPRARASKPGMSNTAAYMTIRNHSKKALTINNASSPISQRTELHIMADEGGVMKMRKVDTLTIDPGQSLELKPGGEHVMLMGLKQAVKDGDQIPVTLMFSNGHKTTVHVTAMDDVTRPAH